MGGYGDVSEEYGEDGGIMIRKKMKKEGKGDTGDMRNMRERGI